MRTYVTIDVSDLDSVDYTDNSVATTSASTARRNVAGTSALISYTGTQPSSISNISSKSASMTHSEALTLMDTDTWYSCTIDLGD